MKKALFLLIILATSCTKDKKEKMLYYLTDNSQKYWDLIYSPNLYDKGKSVTFPLYCYFFDNKGNRSFYMYKKKNRQLYEQGDIEIYPRWDLLSDTLIMLGNKPYKIEKLTEDTFIYVDDKSDRTVLAKSKIK